MHGSIGSCPPRWQLRHEEFRGRLDFFWTSQLTQEIRREVDSLLIHDRDARECLVKRLLSSMHAKPYADEEPVSFA